MIELLQTFELVPRSRVLIADSRQLCFCIADCFMRLDHSIDQLRRHQAAALVRIPAQPDVFSRKLAGLPAEVTLEPGHLRITFTGFEDLLAKLYELSQAASTDFDRFRAAAEPAG